MKHLISDAALKTAVKQGKNDAASFYNHHKLTYKGFNMEYDEVMIGYARIVLLFDNTHNERLTFAVVI